MFGEDASDADELEEDLFLAGLDVTELECMEEDERREALEDAAQVWRLLEK